MPIRIAIVGVGKIVRDQHVPALKANPDYELVAAASPHSVLESVDTYTSVEEMLEARPDIDAVAVCTPPQVRHDIALAAIKAGKHVLLEKPPGATVSEVDSLRDAAEKTGKTLYASWHSRHAPAVPHARDWVQDRDLSKVEIVWREDVRRWHPGQPWIWAAGGLGVFDPGVNALSIATLILPAFFLTSAELSFPANKDAPIAAKLAFNLGGPEMTADFDWRQTGPQTWDIRLTAKDGATLHLEKGGDQLTIDGKSVDTPPEREYGSIYESFAALIKAGESEVDVRPLEQAADAFLLGKRVVVDAFED
jgi:D-galactose 1-dehydrogenase